MEPGILEVPSHLAERLAGGRGQRHGPFLEQAVDIEGPEADPFHVEGRDRAGERLALVEKGGPGVTGGLLLDEPDEITDAGFGGLAGIGGSRHSRLVRMYPTSDRASMAEHSRRAQIDPPDLSEKGGLRNGEPQRSDDRLFMQLLVFRGCPDVRALAGTLAMLPLETVVYEDLNHPSGVAILGLSRDPNDFIDILRPALAHGELATMVLQPEYTMLGRTYSLGYEPDLNDTLIERPRRTVLHPEWRWAIWYPLRRSGAFAQLPPDEQRRILAEHGAIGMAFGAGDYAHDIRLACHGLDHSDNDFVIGLIGRDLFPQSAVVQSMRRTQQTSLYLDRLGPFFVGRKLEPV